MSLQQLDAAQRRVFRLLGVLPGADFGAAAVVALADLPSAQVDAVLEELVDAHLVQELAPGRYRMHDLIRQYATDLAAAEEPQADAALRRVLRHYSARATALDRTLPSPDRRGSAEGDPAAALAWFDLEYVNLLACFDAAVRLGEDEVVAELPQAMRIWFFRHRGTDDQARLLEGGAAAAARLGRGRLRAALLADLGYALATAGRLAEALTAYELAERSGPGEGELAAGLALRMGFARRDLGDLDAARVHFARARALFEEIGHRGGRSQALAFDGWVALHLGRRGEAVELARASVALADGPARITGLVALGVALAPDDPTESLRTLHEALRLSEQHDLPHNQALAHNYLGVALRITGSPEEALAHHRRALELLEPLAEVQLEIDFLHTSAETHRVAGHPAEAVALLDRIIELARKLGRPHDEELARAAREVVSGSASCRQPVARPAIPVAGIVGRGGSAPG
jgi:tetratricopeptide (TPR) repeat protein